MHNARLTVLVLSMMSVAIGSCDYPTATSHTTQATSCAGLCVPPSINPTNGIQGGRYSYGSATINFSSTWQGSSAVARFWTTDPAHPIVTATVSGPSAGSITVSTSAGTFTLTGQESSVPTATSSALHGFNVSDAGQAVARIPFAVGAMSQFLVPSGSSEAQLQSITANAQETQQLRAALTLPLQLQGWYDPTFTTPLPANYPNTQGLNVDAQGYPYILGYWTLGDGSNLSDAIYPEARPAEGEHPEPDAIGSSPGYTGVCGGTPNASFCRGACGINCNSCNKKTTQVCNVATMRIEQTDTYTCPTAPCCKTHDGCYDNCLAAFNCGQKAPGAKHNWNRLKVAACMRLCDVGCIGTWGLLMCGMHIFGGAGTGTTTFTNTYDVGPCES